VWSDKLRAISGNRLMRIRLPTGSYNDANGMIRRLRNETRPVWPGGHRSLGEHYLRDGVSPVFGTMSCKFTAQKFRNAIRNPDLATWVSENRTGIDGFVTVCSTATSRCRLLTAGNHDPVRSTEAPVGRRGRRVVISRAGSLQEHGRRKRLADGRSENRRAVASISGMVLPGSVRRIL